MMPEDVRPGQRFGPYVIEQQIGQGGMAIVYRARQQPLNRVVALKLLPALLARYPTFVQRFTREAETMAGLVHPHILPIYDFGQIDGIFYIASAYASQGTLRERIKGPMPVPDVVRYVDQIADALDYAHRRGIIHRDIKPSNILLTDDLSVMLADFGIAKLIDRETQITTTGTTVGTAEYMSPEQAMGSDTIDARSDIYSLGIVTYELLTGKPPFTGSTFYSVMHKQLYESPPSVPDRIRKANPSLVRVVEHALKKEPIARPKSATEFQQPLQINKVRPSAASTRSAALRFETAIIPAEPVRSPLVEMKGTPIVETIVLPPIAGLVPNRIPSTAKIPIDDGQILRSHKRIENTLIWLLAAFVVLLLTGYAFSFTGPVR